jgi:hypothetical protein
VVPSFVSSVQLPVLTRHLAAPFCFPTHSVPQKIFSVFVCLMVARPRFSLVCQMEQFAASSLEFQNFAVNATYANKGTDNKIGGCTQQNSAKDNNDIHPMHCLIEGLVSKGRDQEADRRYLRQDDCDTDPDDFQVGSLLLEKGLNFFHDQGVFIFVVFCFHGSPPLSKQRPDRYSNGSK